MKQQNLFVSFAMGIPDSEFDNEGLRKGHTGLKIIPEQYDKTIGILVKVLTDFKVKFADIKYIGDTIDSKKHLIINVPPTTSMKSEDENKKLRDKEKFNKMKIIK
jgi:hypothetical protein